MLGATPGQTISVENLKQNAKDEYRQRRLGKNLQNLFCRGSDPKVPLTLTATFALALGLGLTPKKTISV